MHRKIVSSMLFVVLLTAGVQAVKAAAGPVAPQATSRDDQAATSFSADCICDQGSGYLNAYSYQVPFRPQNYKPGTVITVSANGCQYLSACTVQALVGTYRMRIDSWNSNTANVYKFAINGPRQ